MQKKLIALAVAGLMSAPAMAQSNVTIYGLVDLGMVYAKQGDNKFRGVQSGTVSASRIGFKGSEDLGNGLSAKFQLEYGIGADVGSGPTGARQSWVGLDGGFGFVGLGRQYSPGHNGAATMTNFMNSSQMDPLSVLAGAAGATIRVAGSGRINNSINYKSKSFGGLKFEALYGFGERNQDDDRSEGDVVGLGAMYSNGPIEATAVYHRIDGGAGDDQKEWLLGGGYNFGVAQVNLTWQNVDAGSIDNDVWTITGTIPVSEAGKVALGYGHLSHDNSDMDADMYTVAYFHSLSKRTMAYAGYSHVNNDDGAVRPFSAGLDADAGNNGNGFTVGIRHTF
ncbi:porin [Pseudazoarcus pumilus]|uniref:Porin n=1 Tax=Pseudazoarcus pumilus TaxID=2067960 RepID=A0A2I6S8L2_9RHOO|nr:porin [Pseudazoarcus pumilus]AUN95582.1 porin [Pseudazoarcus pumilus]